MLLLIEREGQRNQDIPGHQAFISHLAALNYDLAVIFSSASTEILILGMY